MDHFLAEDSDKKVFRGRSCPHCVQPHGMVILKRTKQTRSFFYGTPQKWSWDILGVLYGKVVAILVPGGDARHHRFQHKIKRNNKSKRASPEEFDMDNNHSNGDYSWIICRYIPRSGITLGFKIPTSPWYHLGLALPTDLSSFQGHPGPRGMVRGLGWKRRLLPDDFQSSSKRIAGLFQIPLNSWSGEVDTLFLAPWGMEVRMGWMETIVFVRKEHLHFWVGSTIF